MTAPLSEQQLAAIRNALVPFEPATGEQVRAAVSDALSVGGHNHQPLIVERLRRAESNLPAIVRRLLDAEAALNESEEDLTGARLSLWEEEQDTKRLRLALESAKRGRRELRAELYTAQAHGRTFMEQRNKHARELLELRKRVAALEAEQRTTNAELDSAVKVIVELHELINSSGAAPAGGGK